jgi:SCY1-like protein 2
VCLRKASNPQILFTRTRILTVKVQTLECFRAMVSTLDATTLTTKLVPLLAKIKTKEPAVMMATLGVHEAMGAKVGLEAIATLVLPQLWSMSMGPLLNVDQFGHFMAVIKSLGSRVESEHSKHLREVKKMEEQTNSFANGNAENPFDFSGGGSSQEVDFEALVKGGGGGAAASSSTATAASAADPWGDGWADEADSTLVSQAVSHLADHRHPYSPVSMSARALQLQHRPCLHAAHPSSARRPSPPHPSTLPPSPPP